MSTIIAKAELTKYFKDCLKNDNFGEFLRQSSTITAPFRPSEASSLIELTIRETLNELVKGKADIHLLERVFQFSIEAALKEKVPGIFPVSVITDLFESSTITQCEEYFSFVETRADIFKQEKFFKVCKNQLLRSCNDLMKRLSRSQKTVFCGRILLFLANIFPLSERSGLNIISEFNVENTTVYSTNPDMFTDSFLEETEKMDLDDDSDSQKPILIDTTMYQKFWGLQDYFRNPNLLYNILKWKIFIRSTKDVLTVFSSFKSHDRNTSKWKQTELSTKDTCVYFAKYLTSPKLLDLELSDSHFRRYVLIQFLILFQYLKCPMKYKLESHVLTEDQQNFIKETSKDIYRLLSETPTKGENFSADVKEILEREERWNAWKNDGCPEFKAATEQAEIEKRCLKRPGEEFQRHKIKKQNTELLKQLNTPPNNWEACQSAKRSFVPTVESFFGIADGKPDPELVSKYKDVGDSKFIWKSLKLLCMKSTHLFHASIPATMSVSEYVCSVVEKMAKEINQNQQDSIDDTIDNENDEFLPEEEASAAAAPQEEAEKPKKEILKRKGLSKTMIDELCEVLQKDWKLLAINLGFADDEIEYFETFEEEEVRIKQVLTIWMERDGSLAKFKKVLEDLKLLDIIGSILSP